MNRKAIVMDDIEAMEEEEVILREMAAVVGILALSLAIKHSQNCS